MIALDALEQLDARRPRADSRRRSPSPRRRPHRDSRRGNRPRTRASSAARRRRARTAPRRPRTTATAECSAWVLPRSAASCSRAPARSAALENRRSPSASVWSAPSTMRPGMLAPPPPWPSPAPAAPPPRPDPSTPARASTRALVDIGGHDLDRQCRRLPAARAAPRFSRQAPADSRRATAACHQLAGCRRRSASSAITAAAVSSIERRVTSMIGQLCLPHSLRADAISSATACRSIYWSASCSRVQAQQPVLADLHDALRARGQPDHQRLRQRFELRRHRHARHQRDSCAVLTPRLAR